MSAPAAKALSLPVSTIAPIAGSASRSSKAMPSSATRAATGGCRSGGKTFLPIPRGNAMKIHPSVKPAVWGAVVGAAAISFVGFSQLGWTLGSTADRLANERADSAIVGVLAPICVEKFQQQSDSATKLIEFKKAASWDQRSLIEKAGWAVMPGTDKSNSAVATACADKLGRIH